MLEQQASQFESKLDLPNQRSYDIATGFLQLPSAVAGANICIQLMPVDSPELMKTIDLQKE